MGKFAERFTPRLRRRDASETSARGAIRIISWNLLHRSGALVGDIAALIEKNQPDLFLMQEVTGAIGSLPASVGGRFYTQSWPGRRHGLAMWSRAPLQTPTALELPASKLPGKLPARFAQVFDIADLTIANVHLSHGQLLNRRQLRQIARATEGPTAIIGDYNSLGPVVLPGFSDVGPRGSTHHAQEIVPFRLDRCMVRQLDCKNARTLLKGPSDHRPILLDFDNPGDIRPEAHNQSTTQITGPD